MRRLTHASIAFALSLVVLASYFAFGGESLVASLEGQALNLRFRLRGPIAPGPETVIVMIDDPTIAALGQWPLSRDHLASAVDRLRDGGARVIVFDLLFGAPGAALPSEAAAVLRASQDRLGLSDPALARRIEEILDTDRPDRRFADALRAAHSVVVPFSFVFQRGDANAVEPPPKVTASAYVAYHLPAGSAPTASLSPVGLLVSPAAILDAADLTADVTVVLDEDGALRFERPVIGYRGDWYPSLPVAAVRAFWGLPDSKIEVRFGDGIAFGDRFVTTDGAMRLPVNYYGPTGTFPTYSFLDLIRGKLPARLVKDRIVLIGGGALGIGDAFATPFTQTLPGPEHYATVIDNILHGRSLIRDELTTALDVLAILGGGIVAAMVTRIGSFPLSALAFGGLVFAWSVLNLGAFVWGHLWLNHVFPTAAMSLNFAWSALARAITEQRQRRLVERHRRNLARYFSPAVAAELATRDRPFEFDRTQDAAIIFVDMVGFTGRSEQMSPGEAMGLLRDFQRRVERAVFANGGTVDKFLGDGALACFGVPEPSPRDPLNVLVCARALAGEIARWRSELAADGKPAFEVGIGVHYGPVLMGDLGGEQQFEFTVVGDTVNAASRLEGLTRELDAVIVASESVIAAARDVGAGDELLAGFAPLPPRRLRGREEAMRVWALASENL
jgi:adenylate cyclase